MKTSSKQFNNDEYHILIGVKGLITGADIEGVTLVIDNSPTKFTRFTSKTWARNKDSEKTHVNYYKWLFSNTTLFGECARFEKMAISHSGELKLIVKTIMRTTPHVDYRIPYSFNQIRNQYEHFSASNNLLHKN